MVFMDASTWPVQHPRILIVDLYITPIHAYVYYSRWHDFGCYYYCLCDDDEQRIRGRLEWHMCLM